jgi:hypothetical protein
LPLAHRVTGLEEDLLDDARLVGAHGDAANRRHRPDRVEGGGPPLLTGHDRCHRLRGRLKRRPLRDGCLDLLELHEAEARDEQQRHGQHHEHPFSHELLVLH